MNILHLGSQSLSRQELLRQAKINFEIINQDFDEAVCPFGHPLEYLVEMIARKKMEHIHMPVGKEEEIFFVLTADTMGQDAQGKIHGKPSDRADAIAKIKALSGQGLVATAFCLERRAYRRGQWISDEQIVQTVTTRYSFYMPDFWIERYLEAVPQYRNISGAITVEGYGAQFLKAIEGSYTTILGLPMFEVRQALEKIGFFICEI